MLIPSLLFITFYFSQQIYTFQTISSNNLGGALDTETRNLDYSDHSSSVLVIDREPEDGHELRRVVEKAELAGRVLVKGCGAFLAVKSSVLVHALELSSEEDDASALGEVLRDLRKVPPSLRPSSISLHLANRSLTARDAKEIGYEWFSVITALHLPFNEIGDEGAFYLADASTLTHSTLSALHLASNQIGDEGALQFAAVIEWGYSTLTRLDLSGNSHIGSKGIEALSRAIVSGRLTALWFQNNMIGDSGVRELANATASETSKLSALHLSGNNIGPAGFEALLDSGAMAKLELLDLSNNPLGDDAAVLLAHAIGAHGAGWKLKTVNLSKTRMGDVGREALTDALRSSDTSITVHYSDQ